MRTPKPKPEIDQQATARQMRKARQKVDMSVRTAAACIGVSAPFLSDLELGRRNWTAKRVAQLAQVYATKVMDDVDEKLARTK